MPLGLDPEGEGDIYSTLVRHVPAGTGKPTAAVLYLHGYTDYFFQRHLAEHFAGLGYTFYAIDLRKCGRSHRPGQTPHYVSDLTLYDAELDAAVAKVRADTDSDVLLMAHSTGGLILPLWLDRLRRSGNLAGISGLVLNSPWFDLQGPAFVRHIGTTIIQTVGRFRGLSVLPGKGIDTYGASLHVSAKGEWEYDLDWKPLTGFPVRFGWLRAIRAGHQQLHRGLDVGVPALILRSKLTRFSREYGPEVDVADAVLDVKQIQRWSGCLGERTTIVPVEDARHDVFLSAPAPMAKAFEELDLWLDWLHAHRSASTDARKPHVAG
ncbi:alpha/beta hydrolase [Aldersonia kunmingensis]|uniref:alpha/beta hydrolase n=1 Tax=Aldersonia kunmingensis TaxID=408066 RepID=UPI0008302492|nr:alpha/beta hydrolase [Aldersonia kunmingensis]